MKEHPIPFTDDMVRAILDGRKTQTRRVVKPQPEGRACWMKASNGVFFYDQWDGTTGREMKPCPYGQPGDRLWVRETWSEGVFSQEHFHESRQVGTEAHHSGVIYRAEGRWDGFEPIKWRPSICMPRWASRITLEITNIHVERLQEIAEDGACAEGIEARPCDQTLAFKDYRDEENWFPAWMDTTHTAAIESFKSLWGSIHGPLAWGKNPWVWVVEFKRVRL